MAVCLPKEIRDKIASALKKGELSLEKLYEMTDAQRNALFQKYAGGNASFINARFEQAMISKQKQALANWIKKTTIATDPIRRDMLKRVEKNKKLLTKDELGRFMDDLVEQKLGFRVTEAEAQQLFDLTEKIRETEAKITSDMPRGTIERFERGWAEQMFKDFVGKRKFVAERGMKIGERLLPQNWWKDIKDFASVTKSVVATLDNSFIGRQGIKVLFTNPTIWAKTFVKSFELGIKELLAKKPEWFGDRPDDIMNALRANIYGDPYALDGHYKAAKNGYGLGILKEEAFPSSLPEKIPILGRIFKSAETAFNGSALYMRHKLANATIAAREAAGVDMLDVGQATAYGKIVSSLTGRGDIGRLATSGELVNVLFFALRFLKSNFDTLTAHMFDKEFTPEARKTAALNTLKIATGLYGFLVTAKVIDPDSTDLDPRSAKFGTIYGIDITGGMRGLVTLGSRLMPTYHDGELGFWTKSASTGKWTKMTGDNFGEQTVLNIVESFIEGKLSPFAGMIRDIFKGRNFAGEKPNIVNTTLGLITPISVQTLIDELKKGNDDLLLVMLAEGLGFSPITFDFRGQGKKWDELKEKKGEQIFNESLKLIQQRFNERVKKLEQTQHWERMNFEKRNDELDKIRKEETDRIFIKYGIR